MNTLATLAVASILCASSAAFADGGKHRVHTPPTPTRTQARTSTAVVNTHAEQTKAKKKLRKGHARLPKAKSAPISTRVM